MRSLIATLLLFLFSFVIAHDTVITIVESEKQPQKQYQLATSDTFSTVEQGKGLNIAQLHMMFHFVALTPVCVTFTLAPNRTEPPAIYHLRYTSGNKETSYKPPIV